jgi:hypothetical protein
MWQVNDEHRSQHSLQIGQPSRNERELRPEYSQSTVETYPPADGVDEVVEVVLAGAPPAPAAGLTGSVTSMYDAPAEPESASTAVAEAHFARSPAASPK